MIKRRGVKIPSSTSRIHMAREALVGFGQLPLKVMARWFQAQGLLQQSVDGFHAIFPHSRAKIDMH